MNPVYLYYPNIVGYGRVISTIIAFYLAFTHPRTAAVFYSLGQGFDAVDGVVARAYGQVSKFGALLDMLTDRMATAVLMIVLSHLYPHVWGVFASLIVLDIVSHWCQMYSKVVQNKTTHKGSANPLLNFYYTFPYALLVFCVGNEMFFITLYLISWWGSLSASLRILCNVCLYGSFPIMALKQFMNIVQLYDSCNEVCEMDVQTTTHKKIQPSHTNAASK